MVKWEEIPWNKDATPEEKAEQFDRQYAENGGNDPQEDTNPYSKENFNK